MHEMVPHENIFKKPTEEDLKNAETEYITAANELNAVDLSDVEKFNDEELVKRGDRYKQASDKYKELHKFLHPEDYQGGNANVTILPNVEVNKDIKDVISFGGLV